MYRKRIIIIILTVIIAVSSCRSLRLTDAEARKGTFEVNSDKLIEKVAVNNIIDEPLAINKIAVTYEDAVERRHFRANLKYNGADSILISIRTFAGIEAARVLIEKDTVKILDRINKILYIGNNEKISKKYGVNIGSIELFFGDINKIENEKKRIKCVDGKAEIIQKEGEGNIIYTVDCNINKLVKVEGNLGIENEDVSGTFNEFRRENGFLYPGKISWQLQGKEIEIQIEMQNLKRIEKSYIVFRTGRDYKEKILR